MSDQVDAIATGLGRASQGLGEAQQQIIAASAKADEIAVQAGARLGMHAIARQLTRVSELLQAGDGLVGGSAQTLGRATARVAQVHAGMSPDQVTKHLTAASGLVDDARTEMFAGLDRLDDAIAQTHIALQGAQPAPLVSLIETAEHTIRDPALREANGAQDTMASLVAAGGQLGNQSWAVAPGSTSHRPAQGSGPTEHPTLRIR